MFRKIQSPFHSCFHIGHCCTTQNFIKVSIQRLAKLSIQLGSALDQTLTGKFALPLPVLRISSSEEVSHSLLAMVLILLLLLAEDYIHLVAPQIQQTHYSWFMSKHFDPPHVDSQTKTNFSPDPNPAELNKNTPCFLLNGAITHDLQEPSLCFIFRVSCCIRSGKRDTVYRSMSCNTSVQNWGLGTLSGTHKRKTVLSWKEQLCIKT